MKVLAVAANIVLVTSSLAFASPAEQISKIEATVKKAAAGKSGEYARELLDTAMITPADAQSELKAGREKEAVQKTELAEQQLKTADVKSTEKETVENVALRRAELKKSEAQLEKYRGGEDN